LKEAFFKMQKKIVEEVEYTRSSYFFKSIPKDELPLFGAEMEVAQIVITQVSDAETKR
jgi:peptidyl-prolyl cis-trans isomerase SurA